MTGMSPFALASQSDTEEVSVTENLAQQISSMDSGSLVGDLKLMLNETKNMTDEEIRSVIVEIAGRYNISLTDAQISQLISLCRSLESLNPDQLKQKVEELQGTVQKLSEAKSKITDFAEKIKSFMESVSAFFEKLSGLIDRFSPKQ